MNAAVQWPPERIAVGVVLYYPDEEDPRLIDDLAGQFEAVFVAENESLVFATENPVVHAHRNRDNAGLARAINQLCDNARQAGFEWLILFDQDSRVPADFRAGFCECMRELEHPPELLAANYETVILGQRFIGYSVGTDKPATELVVALNSGSMINLAVHEKIGGHDERFFVDHVDHEYCLRLAQYGYRVLGTRHPLFQHEVGNIACVRKFGRVWQSSGHSVERRREWACGLILIAKRYWRLKPAWVLASLCVELPRNLLAMLLLESRKTARFKAVLGGLWRGMFTSGSVR